MNEGMNMNVIEFNGLSLDDKIKILRDEVMTKKIKLKDVYDIILYY